MIYLKLFWEFLKVGLFTVGGGLASLPFLYDISDKTGWFSHAQLADMIAVSESTPGPIGINMATYVGFSTAGIFGSIAATIGFIIPSILIVSIVSKFLKKFNENKFVKGAFYGLRAVSVALICSALFSVVKISLVDIPLFEQTGAFFDLINIPGIILAVICFFVLKKYNPHPIVILGASAAAGIIFGFLGIM
ncbi:MAG: chromate transporter [Oscillospiraceae bacterium]|nr:chromate transporter [Oscillospiraceae bacterium]